MARERAQHRGRGIEIRDLGLYARPPGPHSIVGHVKCYDVSRASATIRAQSNALPQTESAGRSRELSARIMLQTLSSLRLRSQGPVWVQPHHAGKQLFGPS